MRAAVGQSTGAGNLMGRPEGELQFHVLRGVGCRRHGCSHRERFQDNSSDAGQPLGLHDFNRSLCHRQSKQAHDGGHGGNNRGNDDLIARFERCSGERDNHRLFGSANGRHFDNRGNSAYFCQHYNDGWNFATILYFRFGAGFAGNCFARHNTAVCCQFWYGGSNVRNHGSLDRGVA